jgi:hypothetical protein
VVVASAVSLLDPEKSDTMSKAARPFTTEIRQAVLVESVHDLRLMPRILIRALNRLAAFCNNVCLVTITTIRSDSMLIS